MTKARLTIKHMQLADLKPHPLNPRDHPAKGSEGWRVMVKSLADDYLDPLAVNSHNGMLISGHFRLKVMLDMGWLSADVVVKDYSERDHLAKMLLYNKQMGVNNMPKLKDILEDLDDGSFDMDMTGFTDEELELMMTACRQPDHVCDCGKAYIVTDKGKIKEVEV